MKKQIILVAVFSFIIFGFGFTNSVFAVGVVYQPIDITSLGDEVGASFTVITPSNPDVSVGTGSPAGLMASADLGVDNVGTLPTSYFYFFKEWGRGIDRLFTWRAVSKVKLELKITNEKAAEVIKVEKAKPDDADALKKALGNYTDAQERLNMRIGKLPAISNPNVEKLLKEVDEKTAKHAEFLEQLAGKIATGTIVNDDADVSKILKNAQDNTLKTFTITVTTVNDAPSLKLKAEEQIGLAGVAINGLDLDQYERIANAKSHLESAKKAFAEGKYGEAYGQARSAEAMVARIGILLDSTSPTISVPVNGDLIPENDETFSTKVQTKTKTAPTPTPTPSISVTPVGDIIAELESTITKLTGSVNPSKFGQSVTFTATVTGGITPTGSVNFLQNGVTNLGSGELNARGVATLTTSSLAVGTHTITATYSGDKTYSSSVSSPYNQVVNVVSSPTTEPSSNNPMSPGSRSPL